LSSSSGRSPTRALGAGISFTAGTARRGACARARRDTPCLGNLRLAFQKACEAAGLVGGRKHGGLVWHCTRNTAATDLAAAGCTIEDVMKVGGWKTADVARRYDLGNLEALRARIAAARERGKIVRLADKRKAQA